MDPRPTDDPTPLMLRNAGRNLAALTGLFFVNLAAFIVCVTLFSLGAGLLVIMVGLFVLVGCLGAAGALARANKSVLAYAGVDLPATRYPRTSGGFGLLRRLRDPQSWRDLIHVPIAFVLSTFSFSVAVSWVFGGIGGVLYWFWGGYLPDDSQGLAYLLGFPNRFAESVVNAALGVIMILTAPAVLHGLVRLHAAVARGLLVDESSALRARVSELTTSRSAAGDEEARTLRRLERDLHDGPQQRLVRLGMDISSAQRRMATDPDQAQRLLDEAYQQTQDALGEIRQLSRGIAPPILSEQGLPAAITALAARNSVPTSVDVGDVTALRRRPERRVLHRRRGADQHGEAQPGLEVQRGDPPARRCRGGRRHRQRAGWGVAVPRPRSGRAGRPAGRCRRHPDGHLAGRRSDPDHRHHPGRARLTPDLGARPAGTSDFCADFTNCGCFRYKSRMRVLVADDSVLLREGLLRLLDEAGHTVVAAVGDAPSLLSAAVEHRPDAAVVDIRMPPTMTDDGLRAAVEARRIVPGMAVLLLSAYVESSYAEALLADGRGGVGLPAQGPGRLARGADRRPDHDPRRRHRARPRRGRPAARPATGRPARAADAARAGGARADGGGP